MLNLGRGALNEDELSQREPEESGDEEQAQPHNETDRKFMKMASEEAKKSPDKKLQVRINKMHLLNGMTKESCH